MEMINSEQIGRTVADYLKAHLAEHIEQLSILTEKKAKEISLTERIIRVEEELKYLREDMNRRFEELIKYTDKRFEDMQKTMDKRFEDMQKTMDKRFEDMQKTMDKRFEELREDMNKRFEMMFKFMSIGFTVVSLLIIVFKFIRVVA